MVERYRRGKGKQKLLGSHQKCWIWGKNAVMETLRAGRWRPHELRLSESLPVETRESASRLAAEMNVPVFLEPPGRLTQRCHSSEHQGFLAKMPPYPYLAAGDLLESLPACPLYLLLDSIQDPYNFGAILRSADAMAVDAVFIGRRRQVGVTSLVARTSAGAVNHVRIAQAPDLVELARQLKRRGVRIIAAVGHAERDCFACDFRQPMALVIGNEAAGVDQSLLELADERIRVPQYGEVDSLNAAVATGILLYEARRQKTSAATPRPRVPAEP